MDYLEKLNENLNRYNETLGDYSDFMGEINENLNSYGNMLKEASGQITDSTKAKVLQITGGIGGFSLGVPLIGKTMKTIATKIKAKRAPKGEEEEGEDEGLTEQQTELTSTDIINEGAEQGEEWIELNRMGPQEVETPEGGMGSNVAEGTTAGESGEEGAVATTSGATSGATEATSAGATAGETFGIDIETATNLLPEGAGAVLSSTTSGVSNAINSTQAVGTSVNNAIQSETALGQTLGETAENTVGNLATTVTETLPATVSETTSGLFSGVTDFMESLGGALSESGIGLGLMVIGGLLTLGTTLASLFKTHKELEEERKEKAEKAYAEASIVSGVQQMGEQATSTFKAPTINVDPSVNVSSALRGAGIV